MRLPPVTPKQMRDELVRRPDVRRKIARGWIVVGALVMLFICAMAVAHYVFGEPIHDANTGQLSTPAHTLMMLCFIGGGGALFFVLGILLYRWNPDRQPR